MFLQGSSGQFITSISSSACVVKLLLDDDTMGPLKSFTSYRQTETKLYMFSLFEIKLYMIIDKYKYIVSATNAVKVLD